MVVYKVLMKLNSNLEYPGNIFGKCFKFKLYSQHNNFVYLEEEQNK